MPAPHAVYILNENSFDLIYGPEEKKDIARQCSIDGMRYDSTIAQDKPDTLSDVEIIFSGWGGPRIDEAFLAAAPELKMVFYGAGSIKGIVTDAFWERGIRITSAYGANAVPVIEFTVAQIILALKHAWPMGLALKRDRNYSAKHTPPGGYGSTVGIISLGMIGRGACERLRSYDLRVVAYDPFATAEEADALGVELVSLESLFQQSDTVSLHTPWLKETENMITRELILSMKEGATFINTARGAVVDEAGMIEALRGRPDLFALLDVTYPEPPAEDSPLYSLPNVLVTPHIAGSMGNECRRMGRYMIDELSRYLAGQPLQWEIDRERAKVLA